jgi:RNA polymerase-associated protein RTF1
MVFRLNDLPDLEREEILAQRQDEMQKLTDKLNLSRLYAAQTGGGTGSGMADDSVAMAAKRKRTQTGTAKEKAHTRDALKASRRAKEERLANHNTESKGRDRDGDNESPSKANRANRTYSSDDSDMEMGSDDESVAASPQKRKNAADEEEKKEKEKDATVAHLSRVQLTRTKLAKECMKPWFEEYVKGAYFYINVHSFLLAYWRISH